MLIFIEGDDMKKLLITLSLFVSCNVMASIADINNSMARANQQFQQQSQSAWRTPFDIANEFARNPNELPICANYTEPNGKKSETKKVVGFAMTGYQINQIERCPNCYPNGNYIALHIGRFVHYVKVTALKKSYIAGIDSEKNKWKLIVNEQCRF